MSKWVWTYFATPTTYPHHLVAIKTTRERREGQESKREESGMREEERFESERD